MVIGTERYKFQLSDITDVTGPHFAIRTYLEHQALRSILGPLQNRERACEVGSGYGRMTILLTEFYKQVDGYEREPEFVEIAKSLVPQVNFYSFETLAKLPAEDATYDLVLTFTCLQHVHDTRIEPAAQEIKRILKPGGYALLCEESDGFFHHDGPPDDFGTTSRSVETYKKLFAPLTLEGTWKRPPEPTYIRMDVGTLMLFKK